MKNGRLKAAGVALGAAIMTVSLIAAPAAADPNPPVTDYRQLAGVGDDTTQDVMNALGEVVGGGDVIASWDARGSAAITTKNPTQNVNCVNIARPYGAGQGRRALQASEGLGQWQSKTITSCIDFARSSSAPGSPNPGGVYTYVPFGVDAVTYAVDRDAVTHLGFPTSLTRLQLEAIYKCVITEINGVAVTPLLPRTGSGIRSFWLSQVDILEDELSSYPCVEQRNNTIDENDGSALGWDFDASTADIVPFSVAQYVSQTNSGETHNGVTIVIDDRLGNAMIGDVGGIAPIVGSATDPVLNMSFPIVRDVYNVVPTHDIEGGSAVPLFIDTFVGPTSDVCQERAVIEAYGFGFRTSSVPGDQLKLHCGAVVLRASS